MGSETVEGLALDMKMLSEEDIAFKSSNLETDALNNMDRLKFLQLNFLELNGSYENFSEDLRWICWHGFNLKIIPPNLNMRNLVAIDLSYSKLEVFEPPMVLTSLRILNLKDSHGLTDICNISMIPHLETLILWNCCSLVNVCNTLGDLTSLALLNMTGCNALTKPAFQFPCSLHRLFLKDCHLECTDSFPLSFSVQLDLLYLNLGNGLFESLPCYDHLEKLRVLDLSFCSRLKCLVSLPSTLAELYVYGCELLERITFQAPRFTLQEFGYLGCICLYEVEGFFKLIPISELDENDLGHMKWLQQYQYHEVCLVGDDELTVGRSWHIQMLFEFNIMSISLSDIRDPNMTPEYKSESSSLSFGVPWCPQNKRLKGMNITFKYAILGDECAWFCKISTRTANGVGDLIYNPKVFGKPEPGSECIWLSYWPIGYMMKVGDTVNVSIVVLSGLEVHECGVSLVYSDNETLENNMECVEILGGDLSGFLLSTGAYYLCRRDFFGLMEVGRLPHDWFRILAGDTIDHTEVRGWRKTGRPEYVYQSFTELKTIGCIINGPQLEDIYSIAEMSKSSTGDKTAPFTSSLILEEMKPGTTFDPTDETLVTQRSSMKEIVVASESDDEYSISSEMSRESGSTSFDLFDEYSSNTGTSKNMGVLDTIFDMFDGSFNTRTSQEYESTRFEPIDETMEALDTMTTYGKSISLGSHVGSSMKSFREFISSRKHVDKRKANVTVNGHHIQDRLVKKAENLAGRIQPGDYWYDPRVGFWGMMGAPCLGIVPPYIEEFNYPMPEKCSNGNTNVFVNGIELHKKDLDLLASRGLPTDAHRSYAIEISGRVLDEDSGLELQSLGKLAPTIERKKKGFGMKPPKNK
ncbi:hypothetical protein QVD17_20600 [Tagetes erecta]|uniref:Uncharacterized protein n=1 Tax=Tagetes erecta TaxID=13708 RepID=A0AAD8NY18_TARER|nr:hypothetical protein QVD17_20600 [Tagetes erecta]